jgi:hypothetical protein
MKEVILTQGQMALIDDEDYELVSQYKWYAHKYKHAFYAQTSAYKNGKQKTIKMHRLIMKAQSKQQVDHINHNGLDNRRANLRLCTNAENQHNQQKTRGTSKYKGVAWCNSRKKWETTIHVNGKNLHLGRFSLEEDAARAYDKAAKKHYGEFAGCNF